MWTIADRIAKAAADVTIGTIIVLAHVTLANREGRRRRRTQRESIAEGTRTQISS